MKTPRVAAIALAIALLAIASVAAIPASGSQDAGDRVTTVFEVDPFDEIHLRGAGNVVIEIGDDSRVEITAPERLSSLFSVAVEDGELQGGFGASVAFDLLLGGPVDYMIVTPSLTNLDLTGPVTTTLDGLTAPEFDLDLSAGANVTLSNVDIADLEVDLELASVATITGNAAVQHIEADTTSTYDAAFLQSGAATVELQTASTATVRVTDALSGTVRTASTLNYITENATVQVETSTAGTLTELPFSPLKTAATPVAATPETATAPQTWDVTIAQFQFEPRTLEIRVGDTVTWTNNDNFPHDVAQLPKGSGFASPSFGKGGTYSVTFDTPGTYDYYCPLHPIMTGTITVVE